jgi:hypothetical protein
LFTNCLICATEGGDTGRGIVSVTVFETDNSEDISLALLLLLGEEDEFKTLDGETDDEEEVEVGAVVGERDASFISEEEDKLSLSLEIVLVIVGSYVVTFNPAMLVLRPREEGDGER